MSHSRQQIQDVQKRIHADDVALDESRTRRGVVLDAARTFPGVRSTFSSGGVAMGVTVHPVKDADGGVILDRRYYPGLGPDSHEGDTPVELVGDLHDHLGPRLRKVWPDATVHDMKRGVTIRMHAPLADGQDPHVDVVLAMERTDGPGLWIPNMQARRWEASHPQRHVELMNSGTRVLRRTRAQMVRLGKAWNEQFSEPAFCSFNMVAFGLDSILVPEPVEVALHRYFEHAAASLADHLTDDPADVSGPIKLRVSRDTAVCRLEEARDHLAAALDHDGDAERVLLELHGVFWKYVPKPSAVNSWGDLADALREGTPRFRSTAGGLAIAGAYKSQRSFGGRRG